MSSSEAGPKAHGEDCCLVSSEGEEVDAIFEALMEEEAAPLPIEADVPVFATSALFLVFSTVDEEEEEEYEVEGVEEEYFEKSAWSFILDDDVLESMDKSSLSDGV